MKTPKERAAEILHDGIHGTHGKDYTVRLIEMISRELTIQDQLAEACRHVIEKASGIGPLLVEDALEAYERRDQ